MSGELEGKGARGVHTFLSSPMAGTAAIATDTLRSLLVDPVGGGNAAMMMQPQQQPTAFQVKPIHAYRTQAACDQARTS